MSMQSQPQHMMCATLVALRTDCKATFKNSIVTLEWLLSKWLQLVLAAVDWEIIWDVFVSTGTN